MHTALNASAARLCTSCTQDDEDEQYLDEEERDLEDYDLEDEEYWSTDELGIDPEDLYDAAATLQPGADRESAKLQPDISGRLAI